MADAQFNKSPIKSFYSALQGFHLVPTVRRRTGSAESRRLSFCRLPERIRVHMCSQQRVRRPPSNRPPALKETATAVSSAVNHQLILAGAATGGHRRRPAQVSPATVADRCSAEIERERESRVTGASSNLWAPKNLQPHYGSWKG